ncbi:hypothetical protein BH09MYX1_BH09MYX1_36200 [soil metagenome]
MRGRTTRLRWAFGSWLLLALSASFACSNDAAPGATPDGSVPTDGGTTTDAGGPDAPRTDPVIRAEHPRIYLDAANKQRLSAKLTAKTGPAERFRAMVDSQLTGTDHYNFQPWNAALMGALNGDAKYCTYAIAQTDAWVTAEEVKIAANQAPAVAGDSYLEVGDVVGGLAMVYDWCFSAVTPAQKTRWVAYANQAVFNVWHPTTAKWGTATIPWSGWSIDDPFNNYHYSFLRATMLLGIATNTENPDAPALVEFFRKDKLVKLVAAFEKDLQGGGSREGTGYGISHRTLFELYDMWEGSTGERIWDLTSHTRLSLPHFIHCTVPTLDRIAPIGDHARDSTAALFDYHREQVLVLQHLIGADPLGNVAQTWLEQASVKEMGQFFEYVWDFLYADASHAKDPLTKLAPTYYGPGTGFTFFRSSWSTDATWGALIAGPYSESHAHHDQGSLLFYRNTWLGYDENIMSHSGIQQGEELHNLVRLVDNGTVLRMQESKSPGETAALSDGPNVLYWAGKMAPLYGNAKVTRVDRDVVFVKPLETFVVFDRIESTVTSSIFQLNAPVTPVLANGHWSIDVGPNGLEIFPLRPTAAANVVSWPSVDSDFNGGARLDLTSAGKSRFLTILGAKGRVTAATSPTPGATTIATVTFACGTTGTFTFSTDGVGGHVTLTGAVTEDRDLVAGVTAPPIFVP